MGSLVPDRRAAVTVHPHEQDPAVGLLEGEVRVPIAILVEPGQARHSRLLGSGDVTDGAPGRDRCAPIRSGSPRVASRPPRRTTPAAMSAGAGAAARPREACYPAGTDRNGRSRLPHAERRRRRRPSALPSSCASAVPSAPAPSPDTRWWPTARARRTPAEAVRRSSRRCRRLLASVRLNPVTHRSVEVAHQDLLVVQQEIAEGPLFEPHL